MPTIHKEIIVKHLNFLSDVKIVKTGCKQAFFLLYVFVLSRIKENKLLY